MSLVYFLFHFINQINNFYFLGKNANSRFSFANNNNHKKEETEGEEYKRKMSKSIQEFLKMSISPSFSPDKKIKTDILFENFISSGYFYIFS